MKTNPIADIVREKRRSAALTQAVLAAKAGVGLRFIRDLEQGKSSLRTDTVNKVLFLFGKCLGALDLPKEEPKPPLAQVMEFLDRKIQQARNIKAETTPSNMRAQFNLLEDLKKSKKTAQLKPKFNPNRLAEYE